MENEDPFIVRVGTFFMVMGLGAFVLFVTSDIAEKVDFDYLFVAMVLLFIGWAMRRSKAPPPPAGRFESLRKMRNKNKGSEKSNPKKE
ncbi:MAG: hypothetical protein AABZ00_18415 [Chloroflexota bacterium]|jgi:hypothetical protein